MPPNADFTEVTYMEIKKLSSALAAYQRSSFDGRSKKEVKQAASKNTDTVEFSAMAKSPEAAKAAAKRSVDGFASPERIAALRASVNAGTYSISSEKIAAAIIDG